MTTITKTEMRYDDRDRSASIFGRHGGSGAVVVLESISFERAAQIERQIRQLEEAAYDAGVRKILDAVIHASRED